MEARVANPTLRWLVFAGLAAAAVLLAIGGGRHALAAHWEGSSNPEEWLRAAQIEPNNAKNWEQLGRYRQFDFEHSDLSLAISYYQRATKIDPRSSFYWTDLASAYDMAGKPTQADQAFRMAQKLYPISGDIAWRYGNFLLRQGREVEAFQQIHRALAVEPELTPLAVSRCWRSTQDVDRILKLVLPATPAAYWGAMTYFVNAQEPDAVVAVWKKIVAEGTPFPLTKAFVPLDMLVQSGDIENAEAVWNQALAMARVVPEHSPSDSLVWNGGFEHHLMDGGFGWRYRPVAGAEVDFDEGTFHSGRRSLRVVFDGSANVDFQNFWEDVPVQPNTRYRFSGYIRTQGLTTDSGLRFVIQDVTNPSPAQSTTSMTGTQAWTPVEMEFTTSPETKLVRITLERPRSSMLDNKIRGTAWVDDVSLVPETIAGSTKQ